MENNQNIKSLMQLIQSMIDESLRSQNSITSGIVDEVHSDGSVDLHIPPDRTIFTNIPNQSPFLLEIGDNVKLIKENGRASNMWIIAKCGISNTGEMNIINSSESGGSNNTSKVKEMLLEYCYPVGSYYWSNLEVSPQEFLGGVWESVEGEMLFAAGKHTITKGDNYSKTIEFNAGDEGGTVYVDFSKSIDDEEDATMFRLAKAKITDSSETLGLAEGSGYSTGLIVVGHGQNTGTSEKTYDGFYTSGNNSYFTAPSNMPPYRVAYCWVRIR